MNRIEKLIEKLEEDYHRENPGLNKLQTTWKKRGRGEGFTLKYAGGTFLLEAKSPQAAVFGISFAKAAALSGHIAEYLGEHHPKLPLRALWVKGSWGQDVAEKVLALGYNAIIIDGPIDQIEAFKDYGIQVIVKPQIEVAEPPFPFEADYHHFLQSIICQISGADYLFFDSTIFRTSLKSHYKARNYLDIDLAKLEIQAVEEQLQGQCKLIYSIPSNGGRQAERQATWLPSLSQETLKDTILAFSATCGKPSSDDLSGHPLWEKLRESSYPAHAQFMPVVNIGQLGFGEGLWPCLALDQVESYLARCEPHVFSGSVVLTAHLPQERAILSCNLWTAAKAQWKNKIPSLLVETWLRAFRPDMTEIQGSQQYLEEVRKISQQLARLVNSSKEASQDRTLSENILTRLSLLQQEIESNSPEQGRKIEQPNLKDYITFFARDVRRLTLHCLKQRQMPLVNVLEKEDMEPSFWTAILMPKGQKVLSSGQVAVFDKPQSGDPATVMRAIYDEVVNAT